MPGYAKQGAKIPVWLVGHNTHFRDSISRLINRCEDLECPLVADSWENAKEGLSTAKMPEVILLDISANGVKGIDAVRMFKEVIPSVHIIIFTNREDSSLVFHALRAGASGYLLKDSSPALVIRAIMEVKAGTTPMNARTANKVINMFKQFNPSKDSLDLTEREKQVLTLLASGLSRKKIAQDLLISFHTVNSHIRKIYKKLQVNTRVGAIVKALKDRLI